VRAAAEQRTGLWPPARWLASYERSWLTADLAAGLTVWALLVPQGLAYGQLAGLPPVHGLYAALGGLALYALFGTSRHLNVGPEATVATLVAATLIPLAGGDPEAYLTLAAILALFTGVVLGVGGLLKLGVVTRLLSTPVLVGYITGSAIVIIGGQLDKLFGLDIDSSQYHTKLGAVLRNLDDINWWDTVIGLATIVFLLVLRRLAPKAPSYLIVVVLAIAATAVFDLDAEGATVVGEIDGGLPSPSFGGVELVEVLSLIMPAVAIGLLAYVDSIATVKAIAQREGYDVDPNAEFFGLAAANVGSGLLSGFSVNGSQSRSFTAAETGAKSQMFSWVAAVLVVVTLLVLTRPFEILPSATLAGIVIVVGMFLIDIQGFRRLWRIKRSDFVFAAITTAGVVIFGMLIGVGIAVLMSLFDVARRTLRPHTAVLVRVPGSDRYADEAELSGTSRVRGLVAYRFDAPLIFANVAVFTDQIDSLIREATPPTTAVLISAEAVTDLDVTALDALVGYVEGLHERGIAVGMARLKTEILDQLERADAVRAFADAYYLEIDDGVEAYEAGTLTIRPTRPRS
jgi:SulP family sulfate permease